jgi:hypothetical protein
MTLRNRLATALTVASLTAASLAAAVLPAHAVDHGRKFRMPSGNIGCAFNSGLLRCDIRSGLQPEPSRSCEFDWTGLDLVHDGKARPVCAGDTVFDNNAPVLSYGHKWKRRGITCRSRTSGLRCHNRKGHGFFLSRDDWNTF